MAPSTFLPRAREVVPIPESYQTICCHWLPSSSVPTLFKARQRRVTFDGTFFLPETADCDVPSQQMMMRLRMGSSLVSRLCWTMYGSSWSSEHRDILSVYWEIVICESIS